MKLPFVLACGLAAAAGCKTDSNAPAAGSVQTPADTTAHAPGRSGRVDLPRVRPQLDDTSTTTDDKGADLSERQKERIKEWDADGDGKLSQSERMEMHKTRLEGMHARFDHDGDGKLTPAELSTTRWFHGDANAADANGDGDISVDELQKAFEGQGGMRGPRGTRPEFRTNKILP